MNYALILAGGIGSRFWPLSNTLKPKQFLNICSDRPLLDETIERISHLIKKDNIYVATNRLYNQKIKYCLKTFKVPFKNVLFEPNSKNTLAPIAFLTNRINRIDPDAIIAVFPCDHIIKQKNIFLKLLSKAFNVADQGYIVTLGITPKRPETGYGYIKIKSKIKEQKSEIYKVDRFIEKPKLSLAKRFLKDKRYYWNSGIFIFRTDIILEEINRFNPNIFRLIRKMNNSKDLNRLWQRLPTISFDYAIMEKTQKAVLLPVKHVWLDIGSWQVVGDIFKKDRFGNIFQGNCIDIGSKDSIIWSDNRLVTTLGLNNMVVVNSKDAILVCSKDKSQDVKKLVQILLKKRNLKQI